VQSDKIEEAKQILGVVRKEHKQLVDDVQALVEAYVELAYLDANNYANKLNVQIKQGTELKLMGNLKILKIKQR